MSFKAEQLRNKASAFFVAEFSASSTDVFTGVKL